MSMDKAFAEQYPCEVRFGSYAMLFPSKHHLLAYLNPSSKAFQPYRESGLIFISKALDDLRRSGTIIDIGANVGDSLALIAQYCNLNVLCVEASDFFYDYLKRNISRNFAGRATAKHAFVMSGDESTPRGLMHWGGTAKPADIPFAEKSEAISIRRLLSSIEHVALLKIDTDGLDLELILSALDQTKRDALQPGFPIYFELECVGQETEAARIFAKEAMEFFGAMRSLGYENAFMWDDPGRFYGLVELGNVSVITNAINYMCHFAHRPLWGLDVCLVHRDDKALTSALSAMLSKNVLLPIGESS
jgi:FkbM family methyltransferase